MDVDSNAVAGKKRRNSAGRAGDPGNSSQQTQPQKKKKATEQTDEGDEVCCTVCCLPAAEANQLSCAVCEMIYHASCCGWGFVPSPTEMKLLSVTGWVCAVCCTGAKAAFNKLQANQTATAKQLLELGARMEILEQKQKNDVTNGGGNKSSRGGSDGRSAGVAQMDQIGGASMDMGGAGDGGGWMTQGRRGARTYANVAAGEPSSQPIALAALVQKTVNVLNRKKSNLVVSGLLETGSEQSDSELFVCLCMDYLSSKPRVVRSVRLGQPSAKTNTRLLLVTIDSVDEVNKILSVAKRLRDAEDDYVSRYIFVNRDLTKEEATASFEKREARRAKAAADSAAASAAAAAASAVAAVSPAAVATTGAAVTPVGSTTSPTAPPQVHEMKGPAVQLNPAAAPFPLPRGPADHHAGPRQYGAMPNSEGSGGAGNGGAAGASSAVADAPAQHRSDAWSADVSGSQGCQ